MCKNLAGNAVPPSMHSVHLVFDIDPEVLATARLSLEQYLIDVAVVAERDAQERSNGGYFPRLWRESRFEQANAMMESMPPLRTAIIVAALDMLATISERIMGHGDEEFGRISSVMIAL